MEWWQAIILGIVEGLTEYLPVSSTGHLILAQRAMGLTGEAADAYAICIQAGAIVAVLGLYWQRVRQAAVGWAGKIGLGPGDADGFRLGLNLLIAFMPAAVFGLLLDEHIEAALFHPWPIAIALFVGGLAIIGVDLWRKRTSSPKDDAIARGSTESEAGRSLDTLTPMMALGIGLIQCVAMWPGTSRSLVTIVGGVLVGLSLASAVEFSFLLGVITLLAATLYKAVLDSVTSPGSGQEVMMLTWMVDQYGWFALLLGVLSAWISAVLAVKWMVAYLKKHGLSIFGYYRVGLAAAVAVLILVGFFEG
ncbi:MAG: undecaprenyl-diphosphate phosphatase [Planctomycetota bacterium]